MNKIFVCYGVKYEPRWLVDQMKENLKWVDGFIELDCTKRDELWIHEGEYRLLLREKARAAKADWILITSPDERWEDDAESKIRTLLTDENKGKVFEFQLWEMFHPKWYRCDGVWAEKKRRRLYSPKDDDTMQFKPIQCSSMPINDRLIEYADVNIYHLKMIEKENRKLRTKVFKILDPSDDMQKCGYDYLDDEENALVKRIAEDRQYHPKYKKYVFSVPEKYLRKEENATRSNDVCVEGGEIDNTVN